MDMFAARGSWNKKSLEQYYAEQDTQKAEEEAARKFEEEAAREAEEIAKRYAEQVATREGETRQKTPVRTEEEYLEIVREQYLLKKPHNGKRSPDSSAELTTEIDALDKIADLSIKERMNILMYLLNAPSNTLPDEPCTPEFLALYLDERRYKPVPPSQYLEWRTHPDITWDVTNVHEALLENGGDIQSTWNALRATALQELMGLELRKLEMQRGENAKGKGKRERKHDGGDGGKPGKKRVVAIKDGIIAAAKSSNAAGEEKPAMTEEQADAAAEMRENRAGFVAGKKKELKDKKAAEKRMQSGKRGGHGKK